MNNGHPFSWITAELLEATGGALLCGDLDNRFIGISIDSRNVSAGDVFVAIIGDVHDGHAFVGDAIARGVQGLVVNKNKADELPAIECQKRNLTCVAVDDTTTALGDLAAFNRRRTNTSVVSITGSNGKTTTRKLTAGVVARKFNTLSTIGNYNNQIGVPLTLLKLKAEHQWAVVEIGTNSPGEIARLAEICGPDIGVITNIGPAHLAGLGSLDGVMREKADLLKKLAPEGKAVLNADDRRLLKLARETDKGVVLFGLSDQATIRAEDVKEEAKAISFTLVLPTEKIPVHLGITGQFMVPNALAAAAVGYLVGLSVQQIKAGLEEFRPAPGRMNVLQTSSGIYIIDDTYNANPDSMKAAIGTLKTLSLNHRSVLIAGDMLELGEQSESLHKQVGAWAAKSGIGRIYVTGEFAEALATGAKDAQMDDRNIFTGTKNEILADLKKYLKPGDRLLIKGSRGMAMEEILTGIKQWASIKP